MFSRRFLVASLFLGVSSLIACVAGDKNDAVAQHASGVATGSGDGCTLTQGYWKNHQAWPTDSLVIGGVRYTEAELLTLLDTPTRGDASLILGHQLIAARLNVLSGASVPADVAKALSDADAWMAANKDADGKLPYHLRKGAAAQAAIALSEKLAAYNEGSIGPGHCGDGPSSGSSGSGSSGSGSSGSGSSGSGSSGSCGSGGSGHGSGSGAGSGSSSSSGSGSSSSASSSSSSGSGGGLCQYQCGAGTNAVCPPDYDCVEGCCEPILY